MKQFKVLGLVLLSVFMLTSCDKDEEDDLSTGETNGNIVGVWRIVDYNYDGKTTSTVQGIEIVSDFTAIGKNMDATMSFTEDPNELTSSGSYDVELTQTVAGQETVQTVPINGFETVGSWDRNGNELVTEAELVSISSPANGSPGDTAAATYIIEELTDSVLRLSSTIEQDVSQPGISAISKVKLNIFLTRE